MSKASDLADQKEESIRNLVRELEDRQRQDYFRLIEKRLKDPDTYAALNYIFVAGLHHFYLGRWQAGIANILIFGLGIVFLVMGHVEIGIALIVAIMLFELTQLLNAQVIVKRFNNRICEKTLEEVTSAH